MTEIRDIINNWLSNLGKITCPVCGKNDIELFGIHSEQHYRCISTGKQLEIKVDYIFEFVEKAPSKH